MMQMELKSEIPQYICCSCRKTIHSFYKFKKVCLEKISHLIRFTKLLQGISDMQGQKYADLQIKLSNQELLKSLEQNEDFQLNIKEDLFQSFDEYDAQTCIVAAEEKFTAFENSMNRELNLKLPKYELEFDYVQNNIARCKENNNQLYEDEVNFSTDKVNSTYYKSLSDATDFKNCTIIEKYKCLICNYGFLSPHKLTIHMKKIHSGIKEKKNTCKKIFVRKGVYECAICKKKFSQKYNLKVHMKLHARIKDYQCLICNKKFVQKYILVRHMKMHAGIRDFQCPICNKAFVLKGSLNVHLKIHAGIKDFQCSICEKKFVEKGNLSQHQRRCRN